MNQRSGIPSVKGTAWPRNDFYRVSVGLCVWAGPIVDEIRERLADGEDGTRAEEGRMAEGSGRCQGASRGGRSEVRKNREVAQRPTGGP